MRIRRFNESAEFEEIEDTLLEIYDLLGNPEKSEYNIGGKVAYTLIWPLGFVIDEYNGSKELDFISKVFDALKTIKSSQLRIRDYDVEFKIKDNLFVRLTPHNEEVSTSYKFVINHDYDIVTFSYGEITKFLKDRGYRIKNTEQDWYNHDENSSIKILTDAPNLVCQELVDLIGNECNEVGEDEIFLDFIYGDGFIELVPTEENLFVHLDRYN
jgi:hypothetical protein